MVIASAPRTDRAVVIVFARRPQPGRVKRRLARTIGPLNASRVYATLLQRSTRQVARIRGARRLLMPAAARDMRWFRHHLRRRGWIIKQQVCGDLGARMAQAMAPWLGRGCTTILIGSDIADLRARDIADAHQLLTTGCEVVLGPAADGGYWLVGLKRPVPGLFTNITWGSADVLAQTQSYLARSGLEVAFVSRRHDVDRGGDLIKWGGVRGQLSRARARSSWAT